MSGPASVFESGEQLLGPGLLDQQLDHADRAPGVVVDVHVLDVDLALARVGEEAGQLPGVVGHGDEHRPGGSRRPAVLPRDRPGAGDALLEHGTQRLAVGGLDRADHHLEPVPDLADGEAQISDDKKTVTIKIRKGVKYAPPVDREVTSADVKYAFERFFSVNVGGQYPGYFNIIEGAPEKPTTGVKPISGITTSVSSRSTPPGCSPHSSTAASASGAESTS